MDILFWKHKCVNPQFAKIMFRITVNRQRVELGSTNIEINVDHWDKDRQRVKKNDPYYSYKNEQLTSLEADITGIFNDFVRKKKPFTGQQLKFAYQNQDDLTLIQGFDRWLKEVKSDTRRSGGTYTVYENVRNKVLNYLISTQKQGMYLQDFEIGDLLAYRKYLQVEQKFAEATIRKHSQTICQMTKWAKNAKLAPADNLAGYRIPMDKQKPLIYLTNEQFEKLRTHKFKNQAAQEVADVFIVYCRTGFHYEDLCRIKAEYKKAIVTGVNGKPWIFWERIKTNVTAKVPFFKEVDDIIAKYDGWENLPIKSNQKMNSWLKLIAAELDFPAAISVKAGRKTLTDWLLNGKGWSKESVKVLLGLKTDRSLEAYGKADERRVILELEKM